MTDTAVPTSSPEFLEVFRRQAGAGGVLSFADFMNLALYDPAAGYYARRRARIGRGPRTDFFTAASLGPVFGELVAAACAILLGRRPPGGHTFVEIGAEPPAPGGSGGGVMAGVAHPFGAAATIPLGRPLVFPSSAVVFSNELFDAQPFHRVVRRAGRWRELGVALRAGRLEEVELPDLAAAVRAVWDRLPAAAPDGYRIDLPLAAAELAGRIAAQSWAGLFVAFDYGKSWRELAEATPAGTARAYHHHAQHDDLLARPGEQDLTCHVCWDWMGEALTAHGFGGPVLESQEAFFVHHAAAALRRLTEAEAGRFSDRKLGVMQLLHPGNMGQKFQVLWALRDQIG
jgi:SAM-dependent MidA family methyltransferase